MKKIKFEKDVNVLIVEEKGNYGIDFCHISVGIKEIDTREMRRVNFEIQWFEGDRYRRGIALKHKHFSYVFDCFNCDEHSYAEELKRLCLNFYNKNILMMEKIPCQKDIFMIFLEKTFNVKKFTKNERFVECCWPKKNNNEKDSDSFYGKLAENREEVKNV